MFGNTKKNEVTQSQPSSVPNSNAINSLVNGTKIEGKIITQNDLRIDGIIEGNLECQGRVIIGESGHVNGNINCQNAIVEGSFEGIIRVIDTLDIKGTGKVKGDVNTGKLIIQPGAVFNVSCDMSTDGKVKSVPDTNKTAK